MALRMKEPPRLFKKGRKKSMRVGVGRTIAGAGTVLVGLATLPLIAGAIRRL